MGRHALELGADTLAFFTRNPRGGAARPVNDEDTARFRALMAQNGFGPIVAHGPYTLNPCSAKESVREFTLQMMREDLARLSDLPESYYNFHPGSHGGQGIEVGTTQIIAALDALAADNRSTLILLEMMAGGGSMVGGKFEEIAAILGGVQNSRHLGVCLDLCHVWDAGYDIVDDLDGVLSEFDRVIGIERLHAVHLNDSKNACGSRKDRHARLGEGQIGLPALARALNHPKLRNLPFVLETPNEDEGWAREIAWVREVTG